DMLNGASQLSALIANRHGDIEEVESPSEVDLAPTPIFRIPRRTRADEGTTPRIIQTLEDTPFYSRSVMETSLGGFTRQGVHESLAGPNLNKRSVQFMLPFRMPRRP
ncbi:MAG: carotenoid 1,2-hydratase, partial [Parvularculaceae bacterium]|nr:carotenoid 1,2-hydratase [Parvularculaceae bacterium]